MVLITDTALKQHSDVKVFHDFATQRCSKLTYHVRYDASPKINHNIRITEAQHARTHTTFIGIALLWGATALSLSRNPTHEFGTSSDQVAAVVA